MASLIPCPKCKGKKVTPDCPYEYGCLYCRDSGTIPERRKPDLVIVELFLDEGRDYVARLASAPGISACGDTPSDALRELSVVASLIPEEFKK